MRADSLGLIARPLATAVLHERIPNVATFIFRCDGSVSIGMGHVMRCRALASALRERGHQICFVMRDLPGHASLVVQEADFEVIALPYFEESTDLTKHDLQSTQEVIRRKGADWVLVDHYGATPDYLRALREGGVRVAVIDDLADRDLDGAGWILNQNLGAQGLAYRAGSDCIRLLGPAYALLGPEFAVVRQSLSRAFSAQDQRVFVTLGGGDTTQLCSEVLLALNRVVRPLSVYCILGGSARLPACLTEIVQTLRHEVRIFRNVTNMADLLAWADVSLNAGGATCWEACCLGLPMVVATVSPDQVLNASGLTQYGCAESLGAWAVNGNSRDLRDLRDPRDLRDLAGLVEALLGEPERRAQMSTKARSLVDGLGAQRAAVSLEAVGSDARRSRASCEAEAAGEAGNDVGQH